MRCVLYVTLVRPKDGNRLALSDVAVLSQTIAAASVDLTLKCLVLRAEGPDFCLGRDATRALPADPQRLQVEAIDPILGLFSGLGEFPMPTIAMIQGRASGMGCALAASCDLAIASRLASFALPELEHDLAPILASSVLLRRIQHGDLARLVFGGEALDAAEAEKLRLVSRVVEPGELEACVGRTVAFLSGRSRSALAAAKQYLIKASRQPEGGSSFAAQAMLAALVGASPKHLRDADGVRTDAIAPADFGGEPHQVAG